MLSEGLLDYVITIIAIPTQHSDYCFFPLIVHPKNSKRLISSFKESLLGVDYTKGINIQCNANLSLIYILPDINVKPFILYIGAEKLLQVTEDINLKTPSTFNV